jgi:SAM-dependent methyltransferase
MTAESDAAASEIAAAAAYEDLHVPALFAEWAPRVADAARIGPSDRVLDVACGTGVLAREAAARVGAHGAVAGVDPDAGMLEIARRRAPHVAWRAGTAETLPYPDAAFDAVVTQFGLMFFADRVAALREMVRVLAPGGRMAIAVWDELERSVPYATLVALLERTVGRPAADALRAPFALGDPSALRALFAEAGLRDTRITTFRGRGRFPSLRTMVEAELRGWLPVMGVVLDEDTIEHILAEAEHALAGHVTHEAEVVFDSSAHIVTFERPPREQAEPEPGTNGKA